MVSAFVSLTLVPMLASRFLTDEAHAKPPGALVPLVRARLQRACSPRTRARSTVALRTASSCCWSRCSPSSPTAWLFITIPKGFFPQEDIGQITVTTEAAEDISFPAMVALQNRVADVLRADPAVGDGQLVQRLRRPERLAERRAACSST